MRPFYWAFRSLATSKALLLAMIASVTLMPSPPAGAHPPTPTTIEGKVVRVVDGDSLVFISSTGNRMTLRLAGIDAPELAMAYGSLAKEMLSDLVGSGEATVQAMKTDRYGRIIAKVFCQGEDVSLKLIREGFAWHYLRYVREQSSEDAEHYANAEEEARARGRGLWQDPKPVPPWIYRKCHTKLCRRREELITP